MGPAWDEALTADRPVVLEVKTDPEVPPLPPHITLQQARHFTASLIKGDPREVNDLTQTARQVLSSPFCLAMAAAKTSVPGAGCVLADGAISSAMARATTATSIPNYSDGNVSHAPRFRFEN